MIRFVQLFNLINYTQSIPVGSYNQLNFTQRKFKIVFRLFIYFMFKSLNSRPYILIVSGDSFSLLWRGSYPFSPKRLLSTFKTACLFYTLVACIVTIVLTDLYITLRIA